MRRSLYNRKALGCVLDLPECATMERCLISNPPFTKPPFGSARPLNRRNMTTYQENRQDNTQTTYKDNRQENGRNENTLKTNKQTYQTTNHASKQVVSHARDKVCQSRTNKSHEQVVEAVEKRPPPNIQAKSLSTIQEAQTQRRTTIQLLGTMCFTHDLPVLKEMVSGSGPLS